MLAHCMYQGHRRACTGMDPVQSFQLAHGTVLIIGSMLCSNFWQYASTIRARTVSLERSAEPAAATVTLSGAVARTSTTNSLGKFTFGKSAKRLLCRCSEQVGIHVYAVHQISYDQRCVRYRRQLHRNSCGKPGSSYSISELEGEYLD